LYEGETGEILDRVWNLQTRLPGCPLSQVVGDLNPLQVGSLGYEAGRYLAHIHQIPLGGFGELFGTPLSSYPTEVSFVYERLKGCMQAPTVRHHFSAQELQAIENTMHAAQLWDRSEACLIHGAYTPENLIVERGVTDYHITGVIEFAYAGAGSPEEDIAQLLCWFQDRPPGLERGVLDGYVETGTMTANFWDRLDRYQILVRLETLATGQLSEAKAEQIANAVRTAVE
jgi:aminoglycoside phosphotransferase (APT) family kinase protein